MRLAPNLQVLRLRDFRLVFSASLASLIGDGVVPVALAFAVLDVTRSATDLGVVLACRTLALLASLLVGGVVADRVGRRTVMVSADLTRLVTQGAIGLLLVTGDATVAEIAISQVVLGAASGFFNPASSGILPAVAGDHLQEANALRGVATGASNLAGPSIAGVLVVTAGPGAALLIDACSYGISALLLGRVGPAAEGHRVPGQPQRFLRDLRDGFTEVRSRTWLWSSLLALSLTNMFATAFPVLGALVAKQRLGGAGAWAAILAARSRRTARSDRPASGLATPATGRFRLCLCGDGGPVTAARDPGATRSAHRRGGARRDRADGVQHAVGHDPSTARA